MFGKDYSNEIELLNKKVNDLFEMQKSTTNTIKSLFEQIKSLQGLIDGMNTRNIY